MTNNTNPFPTDPLPYQGIANRLTEVLDDLIMEAIEEALADDPDFPSHAEDEEGEAYINRRIAEVTRLIKEQL